MTAGGCPARVPVELSEETTLPDCLSAVAISKVSVIPGLLTSSQVKVVGVLRNMLKSCRADRLDMVQQKLR